MGEVRRGSPVGNGRGARRGRDVLIYRGTEYRVANGEVGQQTRALRAQLVAIQQGEAPDPHGWLQAV